MTTYNLRKWVWIARALRHVTEACFGITSIIIMSTSSMILSSMEFIGITGEKVVYLKGSFYVNFAYATGHLFILTGWLFLLYNGAKVIRGKTEYLFGRKRSRQILEKIGGNYLPSDAIKKSGKATIILELVAAVICGTCYLAQPDLSDAASETLTSLISRMMWISIDSTAITAVIGMGLVIFLVIGRIQLNIQLEQRRPKEPKARRRCQKTSFKTLFAKIKSGRYYGSNKRHSRLWSLLKALWAKYRPKRYLDSRRRWRAGR